MYSHSMSQLVTLSKQWHFICSVLQIFAKMKDSDSPVVTTSGIRMEANTRRFHLDEKKEELYRAEVRNKVYKRELVEVRIKCKSHLGAL